VEHILLLTPPLVLSDYALLMGAMLAACRVAGTAWLSLHFSSSFFLHRCLILQGKNALRFASDMAEIQNVTVPTVFMDYTSRKVSIFRMYYIQNVMYFSRHCTHCLHGLHLSQGEQSHASLPTVPAPLLCRTLPRCPCVLVILHCSSV